MNRGGDRHKKTGAVSMTPRAKQRTRMKNQKKQKATTATAASSAGSKGFYLMENPREAERLEVKTDPAVVEEQLEWAGLRSGMRTLEVGCGSGAVTRVMAKLASPQRATGVDQSRDRLAEARRLALQHQLDIEFMEGDAFRLPFTRGEFDFAWSRFLFQYLPHPERALAELVRVTGRGGIVTVADLDGQIEQFYPLEKSLRADLEEALQLLSETGFDPRVGRKLHHMFLRAGLRDLRVRVTPYQVYAGRLNERDWTNWRTKIETTTAHLIQRTGARRR
jgi:ubiquinone/menaquinone biosynthesis C-methylase UbiE